MLGRRLFNYSDERTITPVRPGDYWQLEKTWHGMTPNGLLANLANHAVQENMDGTITVSPSILVNGGGVNPGESTWHGYLEAGVWREC